MSGRESRRRRAVLAGLAVAVAMVTFAGCGLLGDAKNGRAARSDMNMQGAADRADAMLGATVKAIEPEIVWIHDTTTTGSCDVTRYWTVMTVISEQRRGNFLGVVERFWTKSDYKIKSVNQSRTSPAIYAVSPDGFGISLIFGAKGQAFFEVTSPCVQKSEVAPPKTLSNGTTTYEGVDIPYPNVRSDFWSAETPASSPAPSS